MTLLEVSITFGVVFVVMLHFIKLQDIHNTLLDILHKLDGDA